MNVEPEINKKGCRYEKS